MELLAWQAMDAFNRKADTEQAKRIAAELPELARATGDMDQLAAALSTCGLLAYWWNDREAEERFYLAAVEAGRQGKQVRSVRLPLVWLARRADTYIGDFGRSADYGRQIASLEAGTSLFARIGAAQHAARSAFYRGDFAEAVAQAERAVAGAREIGAPFWIAFDEWILGNALFMAGRSAEAIPVLERALFFIARVVPRKTHQ